MFDFEINYDPRDRSPDPEDTSTGPRWANGERRIAQHSHYLVDLYRDKKAKSKRRKASKAASKARHQNRK